MCFRKETINKTAVPREDGSSVRRLQTPADVCAIVEITNQESLHDIADVYLNVDINNYERRESLQNIVFCYFTVGRQ